MDAKPIASRANNNINTEIDIGIFISRAISKINPKPIAGRANNNINAVVDTNIFINRAISTTDVKFIISRLYKANTIIEKKIYKSNLF